MSRNILFYAILAAGFGFTNISADSGVAQQFSPSVTISARHRPGTRIVDADRARIKVLRERGARIKAQESYRRAAAFSSDVTNVAVTYVASIGVGSPATQYNLLVDTGKPRTKHILASR
jgi:hypothetical protein